MVKILNKKEYGPAIDIYGLCYYRVSSHKYTSQWRLLKQLTYHCAACFPFVVLLTFFLLDVKDVNAFSYLLLRLRAKFLPLNFSGLKIFF